MRLIEILGPGCRRCEQATKDVVAVVERTGIEARVVHVTDPAEIATRGLLFDVPGVAIAGGIVSRGRGASRSQIERWLATETAP